MNGIAGGPRDGDMAWVTAVPELPHYVAALGGNRAPGLAGSLVILKCYEAWGVPHLGQDQWFCSCFLAGPRPDIHKTPPGSPGWRPEQPLASPSGPGQVLSLLTTGMPIMKLCP